MGSGKPPCPKCGELMHCASVEREVSGLPTTCELKIWECRRCMRRLKRIHAVQRPLAEQESRFGVLCGCGKKMSPVCRAIRVHEVVFWKCGHCGRQCERIIPKGGCERGRDGGGDARDRAAPGPAFKGGEMIKIIDKITSVKKFGELEVGDPFRFDGALFFKTEEYGKVFNALLVNNGTLHDIEDERLVLPVNLEIAVTRKSG